MQPFSQSQCHQCVHKRDVQTARSHFLMCQQGTPPKYPPQPVVGCAYFEKTPTELPETKPR